VELRGLWIKLSTDWNPKKELAYCAVGDKKEHTSPHRYKEDFAHASYKATNKNAQPEANRDTYSETCGAYRNQGNF
jgi:hypothetical protein